MTAAEWFAQGLDRHRAGDLATAEALYRQVLVANAQHAGAWHLLGVVHTHRGEPEQALACIGRALALCPQEGGYHLNLGVAYQTMGRMPEAEASFRRAVELTPRLAEAHNNLANALYQRGAAAEANSSWEQALRLQPNYAEAHVNLSRALADRGEWAQAAHHCERALFAQPKLAAAWWQWGLALARQKKFAEAADRLRQALRLSPDWPEALCGLGHVLHELKDVVGAEASLRQALRLAPKLAEAHNQLGHLLGGQGRLHEALDHLRQAVAFDPQNAEAQYNVGLAFKLRRGWGPAAEHLQQALRLRPDFTEAASQLSDVLAFQGDLDGALAVLEGALRVTPEKPPLQVALGEAYARQGRLDESEAAFRRAVKLLGPQGAVAHSCLLNTLNFQPGRPTEELFAEHRLWAEQHAQVQRLPIPVARDRDPDRRLRVGYVSSDLIQHVLVHFVEPLFSHHDPDQVELFVFADVTASDLVTARLQQLVPHWRKVCGKTDEEIARQVQADQIDILVDLGGHTGSRLGVFARKPAPIQVTYLGYPNTTGLETMDYRLSDAIADPPGEARCHSEELVRLAGGFCCYQPPREAPEIGPLPAQSFGYVTFGGLHKLSKLNDQVLDLWCEALRAVPTAKLLLFRDVLRGGTREHYQQKFARRGIAPDRLRLEHRIDHPSFLAAYGQIDIALDTQPWNGHATACEALWMGVPTLTLLGDRHAGRMVASVMHQVGLDEFVASTTEEWVNKAIGWASDLDRLELLRSGLRRRMQGSVLCDGRAFTRHLEAAYREMWQRWVNRLHRTQR